LRRRLYFLYCIEVTPVLTPGRLYRTQDLRPWTANPPRLAKRLVRTGALIRVRHGLFAAPIPTEFGAAPAEVDVLRAFLGDAPFIFSGPEIWNSLLLGTTQIFAHRLVYNTKRSGPFTLCNRSYFFRRVNFPLAPSPEWYIVDLFEHGEGMDVVPPELALALTQALRHGRFNAARLWAMTVTYGSLSTRRHIESAIHNVAPDAAARQALAPEQLAWAIHSETLWKEAAEIAANDPQRDVGNIYHALRNLDLTPGERLDRGLTRAQ
jgi:hypothetical protein